MGDLHGFKAPPNKMLINYKWKGGEHSGEALQIPS